MKQRVRISLGLVVLFIFVGGIRIFLVQSHPIYYPSQITGIIVNPPLIKGSQQIIQLKETQSQSLITITTYQYPRYSYGQEIQVNIKKVMYNRVSYPVIEVIGENPNLICQQIYQLQESIIKSIEKQFDFPNSALILGMTFGIERDFGKQIKDQLAKAGVMHIVVASGFNISLIIGLFTALTLKLPLKIRILITLIGLFVYCAIAGYEPPIIRALIMAIGVIIARLFGRQRDSFLWLIYSAMLMILINPGYIISVSFQLSFAATFGIIVFSEVISKRLTVIPDFFRESIATTIPAYFCTLPIILINFGTASGWGILINMLVLWCIPYLTYLGLLTAVVGIIHPLLSIIFVQIAVVILKYFWFVINVFT